MSTTQLPQLSQHNSEQPQSLFDAKNAKRTAEMDMQKIQNRISLLLQEQAKLQKKIQKTEQKATDIYVSKKNQFEKKQQKLFEKKEAPLPFTYQIHVEEFNQLKKAKQQDQLKKSSDARLLREQSKSEIFQVKEQRQLQMQNLRDKVNLIKNEEVQLAKSVSMKLAERREKVRQDMTLEAYQTYQEKVQYDQLIKKLEQDEVQALKTLQQTQNRHKDASEKYQAATKLPFTQWEKKYGTNQKEEQTVY